MTKDHSEAYSQVLYMTLVMYSATDKDPERRPDIYRIIKSFADAEGIEGDLDDIKEFVDVTLEQIEPALASPEEMPFLRRCMEDGQKLKMTSQHVADQYAAAEEMVSEAFRMSKEAVLDDPRNDIAWDTSTPRNRDEVIKHLSGFFPWLDPENPRAWQEIDHCAHVDLLSPTPMFCFYDHPNSVFCVACSAPVVDKSEERALCDICREPVSKDGWITSSYAYGPIIFIGSFCEPCAQKDAASVAG